MWLGVDSGNTRIKWALFDGTKILRHAVCTHPPQFPQAPALDTALIAHVGDAATKTRLHRALAHLPHIHYLQSRPHAAGVRNHYHPPTALGIDRWLNLLAARGRLPAHDSGAVIVSAGTAVTIDILSHAGDFAGGYLLPGVPLMRTALTDATPLPAAPAAAWTGALPRTTAAAIAAGALAAAAGAIDLAHRRHAPGAPLFLTGGDAPQLLPLLPAARHLPLLLFEGMAHLRTAADQA